MVLDRNSRIVRWAYFRFDSPPLWRDHVPERTSLCVIFWRAVLWTPIKVVATVTAALCGIALLCFLVFKLSRHIYVANHALGLVLLSAACAALGVVRLLIDIDRQHTYGTLPTLPTSPSAFHVLSQGARAVKSSVCPLIEIRRS